MAPVTLPSQNCGKILVADLVVGEGVDRLGDALQAEEIGQRAIGPGDDFIGDGVDQRGAVQPAVFPRQREAHHVALREPVEVLLHQRVQRHRAVVVERVALAIDLLGVRGDHLAADLAQDREDAAIVVHGVGRIQRAVVVALRARVLEVILLQPGQRRQVDVVEEELDVFVVEKEVSHA